MEVLNGHQDWRSGKVTFYRRDENDTILVKELRGEWTSYHKEPPPSIYNKYIIWKYKDGNYWKIGWKSKEAREASCKQLGDLALEGDVPPIRRILSDAEEIIIQRPRPGFYDIETDDRVPFQQAILGGARILCISVQLESGDMHSFLLREDTDEAEAEMLESFLELCSRKVDQLIGWNSSRFDDLIIQERARMLGCKSAKVFKRMLFMDMMLCFKKHNLNSADSGAEKQSMALNAVAYTLLKEGKRDLGNFGIHELWLSDPKRLLDYNVQDVTLMPKIEKKTGYLELQFAVCQLCRIFPDTKSLFASRFIDSFMLRLGVVENYHFRSRWYDVVKNDDEEPFEGAFCLTPTELGIHRTVHTFDFSALYPSTFKTFNLSTETKIGKLEEGQTPKPEWILSPGTGIYFDGSKRGIFPIAFKELQKIREQWQIREDAAEPDSVEQKFAARMSMGCKVVINSGYGIFTSDYSRYADREVGESCTLNGAWLNKRVMAWLSEKNMKVLSGDTDSTHFKGCDIDQAKILVKELNEILIPQWINECGCKENYEKLEYEKCFDWVVFSTDGKGNSVKKKYVGQYCLFKGKPVKNGEPKSRGLEYKRGDSLKLARDLQYTIFKMFCDYKFDSFYYEKLIMEWRHKIFNDPLESEDIVQSKSLNKPLNEYKTNAAHIRLAKELEEEGEEVGVGTRVFYFTVDGSVSPKEVALIEEYNGDNADRYEVWNKVYEPSLRLLSGGFPNYKWDVFRARRPRKPLKGQMSLFS